MTPPAKCLTPPAEAGERVVLWVPGRPCLLSVTGVNTHVAAEELESSQEREFRKRHGYVSGANAPEPAVISLNGTVAPPCRYRVSRPRFRLQAFLPLFMLRHAWTARTSAARGNKTGVLPLLFKAWEIKRTSSDTPGLDFLVTYLRLDRF